MSPEVGPALFSDKTVPRTGAVQQVRPIRYDGAGTALPVNILHIYSGGAQGGVQSLFRRVVLGLAAEGIGQHLLLGAREETAPFAAANIPVTTARFRNRFTDLATHWAVRRAIRTAHPDLIQVWPHRANWFVRGGGAVPVVRFLGGPPPLRRLRRFYVDADALLVPGQGTAAYLQQHGWPAAKTCVLRHFAPLARVLPLLRPPGFLVAGVGRLSPEKGFDLLVEALRDCAGVGCWLVGDGVERARLAQMAAAERGSTPGEIPAFAGMTALGGLGEGEAEAEAEAGTGTETEAETEAGATSEQPQIAFLGWQADPGPALAAADVVVVPSREESFGLVILEAWAQGRAVIATDCDGPRHLIEDGVNGLLVPREDVPALAEAIRRLRADPDLRARLGDAGARTVAAEYSEARALRELLQFYQNILDHRGGRRYREGA